MKFIVLALTILTSGIATASSDCPNLSGTFKLEGEGWTETVILSQTEKDGLTEYSLTVEGVTQTILTDGVQRVTEGTDSSWTTTMTLTHFCVAGSLIETVAVKMLNGEKISIHEHGYNVITLDDQKNLKRHGVYTDMQTGQRFVEDFVYIRQ